MKKVIKILVIGFLGLIVFYLIYAGGYIAGVSDTKHNLVPSTISTTISQDPTLIADAQQLGIDYSNVNLSFAKTLNAPDVINSETVGLFTSPNTIQVKSGMNKEQELQTVAYEFMHYFWQNLPNESKQNLTQTYQNYYDNNATFRQNTKYYTGSSDILADERNSTACAVTLPSALSDEFNAYCNHYISNRSILF